MKKKFLGKKGFYIWFSKENKKEYYTTPIVSYNIDCINKEDSNTFQIIYNPDSDSEDTSNRDFLKVLPNSYNHTYEENIGTFLINFLNADFTNSEKAYSSFFCFYGLEILEKYSIKDVVIPENRIDFKDKEEFKEHFDEVFSIVSASLIKLQKKFKNFVDNVYSLNKYQNTNNDNPGDNLLLLKITNNMEKYSKNIIPTVSYKKDLGISSNISLTKHIPNELAMMLNTGRTYHCDNISNICYLILNTLVNYNFKIKICKHCGRYFVPMKKSLEIYCELDPIEPNGKKCKEFAARVTYANNIKDSEALLIYRRTYQKRMMEISRNTDLVAKEKDREKFVKWRKKAQDKIKLFKKGELTEKELYKWMEENT